PLEQRPLARNEAEHQEESSRLPVDARRTGARQEGTSARGHGQAACTIAEEERTKSPAIGPGDQHPTLRLDDEEVEEAVEVPGAAGSMREVQLEQYLGGGAPAVLWRHVVEFAEEGDSQPLRGPPLIARCEGQGRAPRAGPGQCDRGGPRGEPVHADVFTARIVRR